jgi:hypothetical protein
MGHDDDFSTLPLVEDITVRDVFAEFCTGLQFVHGNLHMTFASVIADHSSQGTSSRRVVSGRIVIGAIELRDLLTEIIGALKAQGVITSEPPSPTVMVPSGRSH